MVGKHHRTVTGLLSNPLNVADTAAARQQREVGDRSGHHVFSEGSLRDQRMGFSGSAAKASGRIALGVEINQKGSLTSLGQARREIGCGGRLADTAFLIGYTHNPAHSCIPNNETTTHEACYRCIGTNRCFCHPSRRDGGVSRETAQVCAASLACLFHVKPPS